MLPTEVSTKFDNGIISCEWRLSGKIKVKDETFDIEKESYHILMARGSFNETKRSHRGWGRRPTRVAIQLQNPQSYALGRLYDKCSAPDHVCFALPSGCLSSDS